MRVARRFVIGGAALAGLAACSPSEQPERASSTNGGSPAGELAEPNRSVLFPSPNRLVIDGGRLHAASKDALISWDHEGGIAERFVFAEAGLQPTNVWALRGGTLALAGGDEYSIAIRSLPGGEELGRVTLEDTAERAPNDTAPHSKFLTPQAIATDGEHVAASFGDTVLVFNTSGEKLHSFTPTGYVPAEGNSSLVDLLYAPDGTLIVHSALNACLIQQWRPDGAAPIAVVEDGPKNPQQVAFADEVPLLVATQYTPDEPSMPYKLLDAAGYAVQKQGVLPDIASAIALSPDGKRLISAGGNGTGEARSIMHVTELDTGAAWQTATPGFTPTALAFSSDGERWYALSETKGVMARSMADPQFELEFDRP